MSMHFNGQTNGPDFDSDSNLARCCGKRIADISLSANGVGYDAIVTLYPSCTISVNFRVQLQVDRHSLFSEMLQHFLLLSIEAVV